MTHTQDIYRTAAANALNGTHAGDLQPGARWMDAEDASLYMGIPKSSLAKKRLLGGTHTPKYVKVGRLIRYRTDWCDEWFEANARTSTADQGAAA